jgi:RNA polymerase sigma-70 factor (ECF subfamily)
MDQRRAGQIRGVKVREVVFEDDSSRAARPEFSQLFEDHSTYVWTALRRLGARPGELEDLMHDVFLQVFRQLDSYDSTRPIKPWLFGFAFRIASEDRRRRRRRPQIAGELLEMADFSPGPVEHLLTHERRELAWAALEQLELNRRAVFILHEIDDCAVPDIAESLGIPLATAYSRLRLAREDFSQAARRLRSKQR